MKYLAAILLVGACAAAEYEVGGAAGAGFVKGAGVTGPAGTATAGFKTGAAFGGFLGHNSHSWVGGEFRYGYLQSDLKLSGSGVETSFSGVSHVVHYDLVLHPRKARGNALPFAAIGGGMKIFRGTGKETAYQPMNRYAFLTKTQEVKPMLSAGGGVKIKIGNSVYLRTEIRDYITPFPKKVIAPAPGAKISGWLHDFVPMVGISFEF